MKSTGNWYNRKYQEDITRIKHYKTAKCRTCPALAKCTANPKGRIIERSEYAEGALKNTRRVKNHHEIYSARQQIIEHVFGTIKRQWGFDHILQKGLRKNDGSPSPKSSKIKRSPSSETSATKRTSEGKASAIKRVWVNLSCLQFSKDNQYFRGRGGKCFDFLGYKSIATYGT